MALRELERQTARTLDALSEELNGRVDSDTVAYVGCLHFDRLVRHATVTDYIPLVVYRCTAGLRSLRSQPDAPVCAQPIAGVSLR